MSTPARIGRPPRVTPEDIVQAALEVGLDEANIRNVAAVLKMSPTGLYRHVRTREQLLDLVVEFAFAKAVKDVPDAQSFEEHVLLFGERLFDLYANHPDAIRMVASGYTLVTEKITQILERIIDRGVRAGFTAAESYDIWSRVMAAVIGAATVAASDRAMRQTNTSFISLLGAKTDEVGQSAPRLHELASADFASAETDHFESVRIMIDGLRARYDGRLTST